MNRLVFWRKSSEDEGNSEATQGTAFQPQPEKARKWFDHAKTMADSFNYDSALFYYANGIKLDPEAISAHEAMHEVALRYMSNGGKPAKGSEVRKLEDGSPVSRFAAAEFQWMKDLGNLSLALKTLEAAGKAGQSEFGGWLAPKALYLLRQQKKKPSKSLLIKARDLFVEVGAWDEAMTVGEMAYQLDPSDNELANDLKDLAAQRAMDRGGYTDEAATEKGAYRRFIRDADKQRELEEAESIAGGASVEERNLARAKKAYESNPKDSDAVNHYAQLLKKQDTPEAVEQARQVYMAGFEATGEYRFRAAAGDIRIEQLRRTEREAEARLESDPDDAAAQAELEKRRAERLAAEMKEYSERAERYPTDRHIKFRLGEAAFALGEYDDAMACFQNAKDEPKLRVRAAHMLGRCFAAEDWHAEAIGEYHEALDKLDVTQSERELPLRYDLMLSLIAEAAKENDPEMARQAREICSSIARKDITYRDIRNKRKEVDELIKSISG